MKEIMKKLSKNMIMSGIALGSVDIMILWVLSYIRSHMIVCSDVTSHTLMGDYTYCYVDWPTQSLALLMTVLVILAIVTNLVYLSRLHKDLYGDTNES